MMIINEFEELTVPKVICPPMRVLAFLNSGNKDIHGGHHGAKKSMNTPELLLLQKNHNNHKQSESVKFANIP